MYVIIKSITAAALAGVTLAAIAPQPLVFALQAAGSTAEPQDRVTRLTLHVTGAASNKGEVWVGLYAGEDAFNAGDEILSASPAASPDGVEVVFENLAPGAYGVITFHDENADNDFNRNMIGMPQERYGFSNNPLPRFRAARWEEAAFTLSGEPELRLDIELTGAGR